MRRSLILVFGVSVVLASPAPATADKGTTTVLESTARGTLATSKTARLRFALPASRWTQDKNDDGTPSPGVYTRTSSIGGHSCTVSVFVSGRGQNRRPTLTPRRGQIPFEQARSGTDGAYHWFTARSTGTPGPAAPAPYGAAYRRAPSGSPWKYARIDAGIGFLEPTTSACHRSGARVNLRPLVTSFDVTSVSTAAASASAQAAGTDQTTFLVRQNLTPGTELRGSVAFTTPDGWRETNRSERHTAATFKVAGPGGCSLDLQASVRGVVTASSPSSQVARAVGDAPLGRGNKRGREWGSNGPSLSGGEGEPGFAGIYGIAPIRVRSNRYGQVRVTSQLRGCAADSNNAAAFLAPGGATVKAVNHLLANARPTYRVVKTPRS